MAIKKLLNRAKIKQRDNIYKSIISQNVLSREKRRMNMKFKVIENEMPAFEKELNNFISREDIEIHDVQYSTSGIAPDVEKGWEATNMHNALIKYSDI